MLMLRNVRWLALLVLLVPTTAFGNEGASSATLRMYESFLGGGGGNLSSSSSTLRSGGESVGDIGVGDSFSATLGTQNGYTTTPDPTLSVTVVDSQIDFGTFSTTEATVTTSRFIVSNYTSYGYAVQVIGKPPTNGSHTIDPMTTRDASQVGIEQFGINVVSNTSPVPVGADPDNGISGHGTAAGDYATANNYKFVEGETIATAPKTSGATIYTISYLVNVSSLTPGGQYEGGSSVIVTGLY